MESIFNFSPRTCEACFVSPPTSWVEEKHGRRLRLADSKARAWELECLLKSSAGFESNRAYCVPVAVNNLCTSAAAKIVAIIDQESLLAGSGESRRSATSACTGPHDNGVKLYPRFQMILPISGRQWLNNKPTDRIIITPL